MVDDTMTGRLISCSRWRWPKIEGIDDFKGHKVHSAQWDHSYDYSNKKIGIIGNGSSAIQILPKLAGLEGTQIFSFQRGPTWITPSIGMIMGGAGGPEEPIEPVSRELSEEQNPVDFEKKKRETADNPNPRYSEADIRRLNAPEELKAYRKRLQHEMNKGFHMVSKYSLCILLLRLTESCSLGKDLSETTSLLGSQMQ
jgi:hypothetical protein